MTASNDMIVSENQKNGRLFFIPVKPLRASNMLNMAVISKTLQPYMYQTLFGLFIDGTPYLADNLTKDAVISVDSVSPLSFSLSFIVVTGFSASSNHRFSRSFHEHQLSHPDPENTSFIGSYGNAGFVLFRAGRFSGCPR
jgi:hypothetical protein